MLDLLMRQWMKMQNTRRILQKGILKRHRQISHDVAYMWNLKHGTNELLYKTEIRVQMKKTNLWLPGGKRQGGITWEAGTDIHTLLYIKLITVKDLGLPRWYSGKESACQGRRCKRCRFNPWVKKIP